MPARPDIAAAGPAVAVLVAAFLFNLGQGALRPSLPLYLQAVFRANYRLVTSIPTVFGLGKWLASLPTGSLVDRVGRRPLMIMGLLLIALSDVTCILTDDASAFLALRALAGGGWAMFGTVAITIMVDPRASTRRGRAVSLLFMSETLGLFLGSLGGGWLYRAAGIASPFLFEAGCLLLASMIVARRAESPASLGRPSARESPAQSRVRTALHTPGLSLLSLTNAGLVVIQTGLLVFLLPLHLVNRAAFGPEMVGVLVSVGVVARLAGLWVGGYASDRWGRLRVLVPGLLAYAGLVAMLPSMRHVGTLLAWSLAIGATAGLVLPLPTALIGDLVPPDHHGVAIGWLRTVTDTGQVLGPLVMGTLADAGDLSTPFFVGAVLLLISAAACWRLHVRGIADGRQ
jgi:MFS family permease